LLDRERRGNTFKTRVSKPLSTGPQGLEKKKGHPAQSKIELIATGGS